MGRKRGIRGGWRAVVGLVVAGIAAVLSPAPGNALPTYPVPYNLFVQDEFTNPGGSATGSDDWSCRPSAEHPNPLMLVLVHGTGANRLNMWTTMSPLLANEDYCVFALTFGNYADQPYPINAIGGWGTRRTTPHRSVLSSTTSSRRPGPRGSTSSASHRARSFPTTS